MPAETCPDPGGDAAPTTIARVDSRAGFAELQRAWRELQDCGVVTPYQTFDWVRSWAETAGAASDVEPLLVTGTDHDGRIVAILPLGIRRKRGLSIASFLGDKHANYNLGVFTQDAMRRVTRAELQTMLKQAAASRRVDLYLLHSQPLAFGGIANPLAQLPWTACANSCWSTQLQKDGEAMIRGLRSSESLKKLRAKSRKLGEVGPLRFFKAQDSGTISAILDVFVAQKAEQFRRMGIADPFRDPAVRRFLLRAMQESEGGEPPVSLWALMAGQRVAAVFAGAVHGERLTGMLMSYDVDPAVARNSPGEMLLQHVIRESCERGLSCFDLGTGDGPYKKDYCPVQEPLFDSVLPMTLKGRAAGMVHSVALAAKSSAKKSLVARRLIERLRRTKARLRPR